MSAERSTEAMLWRERVANKPKHWVRAVTACNSRCIFCLDTDTPRNVYLPAEEVRADLDRGLDELGAEKVIISGGEASLHPEFVDFIRYARDRGYDRVQTVTNGFRFADRDFYARCMDAGLGEITFSLHGHTPELHDRLTQTKGAFKRLVKGMVRALRDPHGPIVNVDVVINKQNVAVIDKIVELCISLGVTEFDLLHVIPQAAAFEHRDELFYDVREHLPVLRKVFELTRHPRFVVWTNRFPVPWLEGLEDLIQDPHKMLDEVNGRRFQVRRYLDNGKALDCRQPERCVHCFREPFCTTVDRVVAAQNAARWQIYWTGDQPFDGELPYGCDTLGVAVAGLAGVAELTMHPLYVRIDSAEALPPDLASQRPLTLVAARAAQAEAWLRAPLPAGVQVDIELNRDTAPWMLANRGLLDERREHIRLHQPSYEHMEQAVAQDVADPRAFFLELGLRLPVSGLPACLAPGCEHVEARLVLDRALFDADSGRLAIRPLARYHIEQGYRSKSIRCDDCVLASRCDGAHINMIRHQGLALLTPLIDGPEAEDALAQAEARWPQPELRLATGRAPEAVAPSLPGYPEPPEAPRDPLAVIGDAQALRRAARRRA